MSQTITMTELLRNPKKVRALVKKGIKLYVLYEGKVAMVITLPNQIESGDNPSSNAKSNTPPTVESGLKNYTITREDIYGEDSWLDK
ncbi:MAG: hypothetical protein WCK98_06040 [bacterium]